MYTITSKPDGTYTVTIQLPNTRALAEWLKAQGTDTASTSQMHSSQEAMQIARKLGHSVPITTLNSACSRGTIAGAVKDGKRWRIPHDSLLSWLNRKGEAVHDEDNVLWGERTH